jgi:hypothetical protein
MSNDIVSKECHMDMKLMLKNGNNKEIAVEIRFAADGVYVLRNDTVTHFNELTVDNKRRVIKHCMNNTKVVNE